MEQKKCMLTNEERAEIAKCGLFPLSPQATIEYTPDVYELNNVPEHLRPVYKLRAWTASERDEYKRTLRTNLYQALENVAALSDAKKTDILASIVKGDDETTTEFENRKSNALLSYVTGGGARLMVSENEIRRLIVACVVGWENRFDADGVEIPFSADKVIETITDPELVWIKQKVVDISCLNAREMQALK
jgi:hypothetical protein